ncbi:hypothetical protein JCM6882_000606 [Rhodosporidiobolus microsporus]
MDSLPSRAKCDQIVQRHHRKQTRDGPLLTESDRRNIIAFLADTNDTSVRDQGWRFRAKNRFKFEPLTNTLRDMNAGGKRRKGDAAKTRVVTVEEIYDVIVAAHVVRGRHQGRDKTFDLIQKKYSRLPKEIVREFIQICPSCSGRQKTTSSSSVASTSAFTSAPSSPATTPPSTPKRSPSPGALRALRKRESAPSPPDEPHPSTLIRPVSRAALVSLIPSSWSATLDGGVNPGKAAPRRYSLPAALPACSSSSSFEPKTPTSRPRFFEEALAKLGAKTESASSSPSFADVESPCPSPTPSCFSSASSTSSYDDDVPMTPPTDSELDASPVCASATDADANAFFRFGVNSHRKFSFKPSQATVFSASPSSTSTALNTYHERPFRFGTDSKADFSFAAKASLPYGVPSAASDSVSHATYACTAYFSSASFSPADPLVDIASPPSTPSSSPTSSPWSAFSALPPSFLSTPEPAFTPAFTPDSPLSTPTTDVFPTPLDLSSLADDDEAAPPPPSPFKPSSPMGRGNDVVLTLALGRGVKRGREDEGADEGEDEETFWTGGAKRRRATA